MAAQSLLRLALACALVNSADASSQPTTRAAVATPVAAAAPFPRMSAFAAAYVAHEVAVFRAGAKALAPTAVRDLAAAAWALLALAAPAPPTDANVSLAVAMVDACFAVQLPSGQFPWNFGEFPAALDNNSVQFTSLPVLRMVAAFGDRIGAATLARWAPKLRLAAAASFAEGNGAGTEAQPYYTNIATMRIVNLHLFGQVLGGDPIILAQAGAATAAWTLLVDGAGVHEYSSPTYTAVALANLFGGAGAIADAAVSATLRRYALFLLAHSAAGFWAPARELGGAHSRDYDFVFGSAGMDWVYALTGIAAAGGVADADNFVLDQDPITMAELLVCFVRGDLPSPLPPLIAALAAPPGPAPGAWRVAQASFLATAGNATAVNGTDAYFYSSAAATLGVSSLFYGAQDKMVTAQLALSPGGAPPAASPRHAQVTFVQDAFDSPYGYVKSADGSGHEKPTHLKATVAAVQDRGLALVLNDLSMAIENTTHQGPWRSLAANVLFPAGPGVDGVYTLRGGRVANVSRGAPDVPLALGEAVAVRSAGGVVAFRVPFADGLNGFMPRSALRFDGAEGTDAARLVTYLYQGPNVTFPNSPPPSRSVLVIGVGSAGSDTEALAFLGALSSLVVANEPQNATNWRVSVSPPAGAAGEAAAAAAPGFGSTLAASLWVPDRKQILSRRVNGSDVHVPAGGTLELLDSSGAVQRITTASFA